MLDKDWSETGELIKRANRVGIKIQYDEGLIIKLPKGIKIDPELVQELKAKKELLINYLTLSKTGSENEPGVPSAIPVLYNEEKYYRISPIQIYWVDDEIDAEYKKMDSIHGTIHIIYDVFQPLDIDCFVKAVEYIISRHESLRASFHNIEGEFLMKVGRVEMDQYFSLLDGADHDRVDDFINYSGHKFDLTQGSLFQVRLVKLDDQHSIIAFKLHHVIFDALSIEILIKEIFSSYQAFIKNISPGIPLLSGQYKDYLAAIVDNISENHALHFQYWANRFTTLPPEIILPGIERVNYSIRGKVLKVERFSFTLKQCDQLLFVAKKNNVSLFVVLQSLFNYYIMKTLGITDIMVGTYVYGRHYHGCENQIGCYANTSLIRTVLLPVDGLKEVIEKVNHSNIEMNSYTACSLLTYLKTLLSSQDDTGKDFWNINMQFSDSNRSYMDNVMGGAAAVQANKALKRRAGENNSLISNDMQLQFIKVDTGLNLRVQYDSSLYTPVNIQSFISSFLEFIQTVAYVS